MSPQKLLHAVADRFDLIDLELSLARPVTDYDDETAYDLAAILLILVERSLARRETGLFALARNARCIKRARDLLTWSATFARSLEPA